MAIKEFKLLVFVILFFSGNAYAGSLIDKLKTGVNIADDAVSLFRDVLDFVDSKNNVSKSVSYKNDTISIGNEVDNNLSEKDEKLSDEYRRFAWKKAKIKDHISALSFYRKSLELNANNARSWHGYGWTLSELGLYDQAKNAFIMSLKLEKNDETWRFLGWNYERQGLLSEGKEAYVEALVFNGNNKKAKFAFENLSKKSQQIKEIKYFAIQTAAFDSEDSAKVELEKAKLISKDARITKINEKYCVLFGNYLNKQQAIDAKKNLVRSSDVAKDFYVRGI